MTAQTPESLIAELERLLAQDAATVASLQGALVEMAATRTAPVALLALAAALYDAPANRAHLEGEDRWQSNALSLMIQARNEGGFTVADYTAAREIMGDARFYSGPSARRALRRCAGQVSL